MEKKVEAILSKQCYHHTARYLEKIFFLVDKEVGTNERFQAKRYLDKFHFKWIAFVAFCVRIEQVPDKSKGHPNKNSIS